MTLVSREFDPNTPLDIQRNGDLGLFELQPCSLPVTSGVRTPNLGEHEFLPRDIEMDPYAQVREQERQLQSAKLVEMQRKYEA